VRRGKVGSERESSLGHWSRYVPNDGYNEFIDVFIQSSRQE